MLTDKRQTALSPATSSTPAQAQARPARQQNSMGKVARTLPEYLTAAEVEIMLECAPHIDARLLMLIQWRAGLRVSEALALTWADVQLDEDDPTVRVRQGKGRRSRIVPLHAELGTSLRLVADARRKRRGERIISRARHRSAAFKWIKAALDQAVDQGRLSEGRKVSTHTFRHSYARHLLLHGVKLNELSRWLGHAQITTTLIYLELVPDPSGSMATVP